MNRFRIIGLIIGILFSFTTKAQKAEKIVSLAPSLTKNIYYLEAQSQLVGCTSYCTEALAENKEAVASAIKVNIEKTISLQPDLIIVTTITASETIKLLENFDIQVEVFSSPKDFTQICEQFKRLGKLVGKEEMAKQIIDKSAQTVNRIKASFSNEPSKEILFQIGAEPIFTVLPNTFMNDYITFTNGQNIASGKIGGTLTREFVLMKNPAYIFIVTMGIVGEEEKKVWEAFEDLNAAKNQHIYIVDADKACSPTPVTFAETLETVANFMHQQP